MRYLILMGSSRKEGNTIKILRPFIDVLNQAQQEVKLIWLYDKQIHSCIACRKCQDDWSGFGCSISDDMQEIFDEVLAADRIILATPVYSWYCTPPMKALLDRLVYGMNKYYGRHKGPALWKGKQLSLITTCGYEPGKGADLLELGIKRYCKHSSLQYLGMFVLRDQGYDVPFMNEEREEKVKYFARYLTEKAGI